MKADANPIIAGNWKMHKTVDEAVTLLRTASVTGHLPGKVETVICAPFPALPALGRGGEGSGIGIGAQNMHWEEEGAYTGEVSARMLKDLGVRYVDHRPFRAAGLFCRDG